MHPKDAEPNENVVAGLSVCNDIVEVCSQRSPAPAQKVFLVTVAIRDFRPNEFIRLRLLRRKPFSPALILLAFEDSRHPIPVATITEPARFFHFAGSQPSGSISNASVSR